ncbi:glycine dehydrogenase [Xylaria bambusicola]|uniref:glycine dehydrogenase n=1 Tax=Xylaria bambusicola TaxID=326684 RepID=UPI00200839A8|nr:glycine dehydrogenase [Xylaria bambusicola]KAI0521050.1 glycine dehydrogenase [Xylaria bambusicola]
MASSLARAVPQPLGQLSVQSRALCLRPRLSSAHTRTCLSPRIGRAGVGRRNYSETPIPKTGQHINSPPSLEDRAGGFAQLDTFVRRHIGPDDAETTEMLKALSPPVQDLDDFVSQVLPPDIRAQTALSFKGATEPSESYLMYKARYLVAGDFVRKTFIGQGYYQALTPSVIQRNVLENPAWYTSYTPYQPEISQGRLESLLNFQTMVSDLTALPIANASLLDEGTAAAEAMTLSMNVLPPSRAKRPGKTYVVSTTMHPQTIAVMRGRAEGFGITILSLDLSQEESHAEIEALGDDLVGVMVQYPDTFGGVDDHSALAEVVHKQGALLSVATDLLALAVLKPPGEWGADIAFGSAQRFGIPLGFGGPHAAFFSVTEKHKRKIPGRLVGLSKDRMGRNAYRLALQTREQHIRREKATSNVCTSQALLANMSAFYAIYHGPEGLKAIAERSIRGARAVQAGAEAHGFQVMKNKWDKLGRVLFDTVVVDLRTNPLQQQYIFLVKSAGCLVRRIGPTKIGISVDEATTHGHLALVIAAFRNLRERKDERGLRLVDSEYLKRTLSRNAGPLDIPEPFRRTSSFMTHPVFNTHHSETEMLRYIHHLQSKDLSLVHSMIPLGSCTMKLNGTTEMSLISVLKFSNVHPYAPPEDVRGYIEMLEQLSRQLAQITGMDKTSLQPNSGAQGEFAGLRAIRGYHKANKRLGKEETERDICLIPVSAHGTNPASAAMAGMRVVPIKCNSETGNLDIADLEAKCKQYQDKLGAIMVTYPSTFGVFEPEIKKVCQIVHEHGGQVYMDGANMNAQIGLCSPGEIGADVCHLNLHKTFCIPHGGGGPGVGPICVKSHLAEFLPGDPNPKPPRNRFLDTSLETNTDSRAVSSSEYGSASINVISWAYNTLMGGDGLTHATKMTLLNANYILSRLKPHYPILYVNENERCAHEFILDTRPFSKSAGIEAIDIAKRLQDYGFHAPTMSWPVANTLMIEPTESESKEELDRFIDALISIRGEIREVEEGKVPREGNVLKNAPHPMQDLIQGDGDGKWERSYSREKAVYPLPWLKEKKFWPSVARIDDTYGDLNLFCTCPPVEDTTSA